jgi:3-oxoacyl-(acyl-carrier-protein) synthase
LRFDADRRPVVTGVGLLTPLGLTRELTLEGLWSQRCEVEPIQRFDAGTFPWNHAAEIKGFVPRQVLPDRKAIKLMSPPARLAVAAALEARDHAGIGEDTDPRDGGLYVAAGYETIDLQSVLGMMGACRPLPSGPEEQDRDTIDVLRLWREARYRMNPLNALKILPNMALAHVSIATGLQGPNSSIGPHGSSGLQAVADAALAVGDGEAPYALAGGTDSPINIFMTAYFGVEGLLSEQGRCRPFARDADGTVLGEAAAFLWIEPRQAALDRGAQPLAALLSAGQAHDPGPYGPPRHPDAWLRAGEQALADAGLGPRDIARWTADGWGVPRVDRAERAAAEELFRGRLPRRRATKDLLGHTFAAAGAVEVGLSCCDPADGPELIWAAGVDGTVAALVIAPEEATS